MPEVSSSANSFLKKLNPYAPKYGGFKAFLSDARKEGIIKPVLYGFVIGTGVFDVSSGLGKKLVRQPMSKWVAKPLKRIMGFEKPAKNTLKDKILNIVESPEVTFGLSSGVGAAMALTGLYGAHHLIKKAVSKPAPQKDQTKT